MSALQDLLDAPDRAVEACSHRARRLLERRMFGADRVECREELAVGGLAVGGTGFGMATGRRGAFRSEEHTSTPVTHAHLVCRLLLEQKKQKKINTQTNTLTPT